MREWQALPQIPELPHADVLAVIESRDWSGKGLGFVDVHLLASVLRREGTSLWTRDKRLDRLASTLSIAYVESN